MQTLLYSVVEHHHHCACEEFAGAIQKPGNILAGMGLHAGEQTRKLVEKQKLQHPYILTIAGRVLLGWGGTCHVVPCSTVPVTVTTKPIAMMPYSSILGPQATMIELYKVVLPVVIQGRPPQTKRVGPEVWWPSFGLTY